MDSFNDPHFFSRFSMAELLTLAKMEVSCLMQIMLTLSGAPGDYIKALTQVSRFLV